MKPSHLGRIPCIKRSLIDKVVWEFGVDSLKLVLTHSWEYESGFRETNESGYGAWLGLSSSFVVLLPNSWLSHGFVLWLALPEIAIFSIGPQRGFCGRYTNVPSLYSSVRNPIPWSIHLFFTLGRCLSVVAKPHVACLVAASHYAIHHLRPQFED